jgi:hypothetical protein
MTESGIGMFADIGLNLLLKILRHPLFFHFEQISTMCLRVLISESVFCNSRLLFYNS